MVTIRVDIRVTHPAYQIHATQPFRLHARAQRASAALDPVGVHVALSHARFGAALGCWGRGGVGAVRLAL